MKKRILFWTISALFVLNLFTWSFLFSLEKEKSEVVFFDVGQGDAIFIRTPQDHRILIDGGPGEKILEKIGREVSFLENEIDLVILTHPHEDHVSGLVEVLKTYDVKEILYTGVKGRNVSAKEWEKRVEKKGYRVAKKGKRVSANNFSIDILYPEKDLRGKGVKDFNATSVVSRLTLEGKTFLFMGDAYSTQEKEILSSFPSLDSDVLKVGHHGSKTSTSSEFLSAVDPLYSVIMAGEDNRYGHPHKETLETLENHSTEVLRTDRDGTIRFVY